MFHFVFFYALAASLACFDRLGSLGTVSQNRPFGNSTSAGSSSSSQVPKLGYHSRGSWALLCLDLLHLSSKHCLPPRVKSTLRSRFPLLLRPSLAALARATASLALSSSQHSFAPSLLHRSNAPNSSLAPFLLESPAPGAAPLLLASALSMFQQKQTCRSCVSIGKCSGTMCLLYSASERHRFCCEFMRALVCCALGRLQRAAQVCDCDGATSERGGTCRALICQDCKGSKSFSCREHIAQSTSHTQAMIFLLKERAESLAPVREITAR